MDSFEISEKDLKIVEQQMGRELKNKMRVASVCKYGYPMTIKNYPILNKKPFPTMYWLTCPYLNEEISKLESRNKIEEIQNKIDQDTNLSNKIQDAHLKEIQERLEIIDDEINELPEPMQKTLREKGVGGISDFKFVKCLHLHYASYISGNDNPIGEKVDSLLENRYCTNCICCNYEK
ncbi:MAG: DUF501 domain-containing protein [Thermotogota bacterium]